MIDLTARLFALSPYEAAKKLAADFGIDPDKPPSTAALAKPKHPMFRAFREDERYCQRVLCDYLHLLEDWKVRYAPKNMDDDNMTGLWKLVRCSITLNIWLTS